MAEQIIIGVSIVVVTSGLGFIFVQLRKIIRKMELNCIKHDALVYAMHEFTQDGLMDNYNDYIDRHIKDIEHIER